MAMQAEETLPPACQMAQNYETAASNPEIHLLPGNLKDARDTVFPYFWGTDSWSSPLHLENVKGPANYASLVGALACLLKNPNLCTDTYSQRSNELEIKASMAMRLDLLETKLEELHRDGARVAFVVATFGTTDAFGVDDVAGIRKLIDLFATRHRVPVPQLHVDAAVGWVLSFLADYNIAQNPLGFSDDLLPLVWRAQRYTEGLRVADGSLSADQYARYTDEIHRLFERREKAMGDQPISTTPPTSSSIASRAPSHAPANQPHRRCEASLRQPANKI